MQKPTIAIIGPGRAGSALGRALRSAGYPIAAIGGRNPDNVRNLAEELGARACQSPATAIEIGRLGGAGVLLHIDAGGRWRAHEFVEVVVGGAYMQEYFGE